MARSQFTRRCFDEDLQRLPKSAQREAERIAEEIAGNPSIGEQSEPPLEDFRRVWIRTEYRLFYTYDFQRDTYWVVLVGERRPGKAKDVYEMLQKLIEVGLELKSRPERSPVL